MRVAYNLLLNVYHSKLASQVSLDSPRKSNASLKVIHKLLIGYGTRYVDFGDSPTVKQSNGTTAHLFMLIIFDIPMPAQHSF